MSGRDAGGRAGGEDRFPDEWDRCEAAYLVRLRRASEVGGDWRDRLRASAWATVRLAQAHPAAARLLVVDALAHGRAGQERQRALNGRLLKMLESWRLESGEPASPAWSRWALGVFFAAFRRRISGGELEALAAEVPRLMFLAVSPACGVEAALAELERPPPWPPGRAAS